MLELAILYVDGRVTVPVRDLRRAIGFYTETLGLRLRLLVGRDYAEVRGPGLSIGLVERPGRQAAGAPLSIALEVPDLVDAVRALRARGVILAEEEDSRESLARFVDPDGNPLLLRGPTLG